MELIVLHDGREERLAVERHGGFWRVTLGGREFVVDSSAATATVRSLLIGGRQFEVAVRSLGDGRYQVSSGGGLEEVTVVDPLTHLARAGAAAAAAASPRKITAYMPGRVVQLLVEEGERVEPGQGLVVLEAMKMENEIQAESAGVVRRVFVAAGEAVEGGDPLFEIE